ncbi:MAG: archaetidylserine decarboxylase [Spirochaetota bacterium]|nr:archaetidylserine decarboxylase [Spirochaetota bacterium]
MNNKNLLIFLFKIIPKALVSRIVGGLAEISLPKFILHPLIEFFCSKYGVNKDEIFVPEGGFRSFDQFFTRNLREGVHIFDSSEASVISPVDAVVDQFGQINHTNLIQAKGIEYSLRDLIPSESCIDYTDGAFMTLYLSPADYHRIHSPVSGRVVGCFHIPGKLFTVQDYMVNGLKGLFTINERFISYIMGDYGMVAVCKVGAMNVGRISLSYSDKVTNKAFRKRCELLFHQDSQPEISKGEELGIFHLGSTVILLFQKDAVKFEDIIIGTKVRVGERIASFL